ncbi:MAG: hypothetical protein ACRD3F_03595, partial [Acidobacteriaceae bacterium]
LPDNANWIKWYSAIVLYSRYYQQAAASLDAPYHVLPAGIYRISGAAILPQSPSWRALETASRDMFVAEVKRGLPLGDDFYLRRYPVWFQFRGNSSVLLSEAKALSTAAQLRGDIAGENLAQQQAQWLIGRNPFSASIMYGEGYDWTPLYSVRSGQMVGALPVGIETKGIADEPYWPNQICWTYKEVWTQPVGEWIWLMSDLNGPAIVRGIADPGTRNKIRLVDAQTHRVIVSQAAADGTFHAALPQGRYLIETGAARTSLTALAGGVYHVDLRTEHAVTFTVSSEPAGPQEITIRARIEGAGKHSFTLRADNLAVAESGTVSVELGVHGERAITWHARIVDASTPWVAVVLRDGSLSGHAELSGIAKDRDRQ